MKKHAEKLVAGSFGLAITFLFIAGAASYVSIQKLTEKKQQVAHTRKILEALHQAHDHIRFADGGQRGYIITQQEKSLETYRISIQKTHEGIATIRRLSVDNLQKQQLDKLEALITAKLAVNEQSIDLLQQNPSERTAQIALTNQAMQLQQAIQAQMAVIIADQKSQLQQQIAASNATVRITVCLAGIGYGCSILLMIVIYFLLQRQIRIRQQSEQALWESQQQLEVRVTERTAELRLLNEQLQREIEQHQKTEAQLIESEYRYTTLAAIAPVGIFHTDTQGYCLYVNERWCQITGLTASEALGIGWVKSLHPEDRIRIAADWERTVQEQIPFHSEYRFQHPDGKVTWVFGQAVLEQAPDGQIIGYVGTITDISDRKQAEAALATSEAEYRRLFENNPNPMWVFDRETLAFLAVNHAAIEHYGYSESEFLAMTIADIRPQEDIPALKHSITQSQLTSHFGCWRHRKRDGSLIDVEITSHAITWGGRTAGFVLAQDITARKLAESALQQLNQELETRVEQRTAALQESQRFIQRIADTLPNFLYIYDLQEQRNIYTNRQVANFLGYTQEEILAMGTSLLAIIMHPEDVVRVGAYLRQLEMAQDGDIFEFEYRLREVSGEWRWFYSRDTVFTRNAQGKVTQILGAAQDITARKQTEERLRRSQAHMADAQRVAHFGSWEYDIATRKITWTLETFRIFGRNPAQGEPTYEELLQYVHPDDREKHNQVMERAIAHKKPPEIDLRFFRPDGSIGYLYAKGQPILGDRGEVVRVLGTVIDITERKRAEQQLQKLNQELMQSNQELKQFAYIASHDLQEPLRAITGYTQLLEQEYSHCLNDTAQEYLAEIVDGAGRMQQLIQDLLAYSRIGTHSETFTPIDCNTILHQALRNLQLSITQSNAIISYEPLPTVTADKTQLLQLFQNLIGNAIKFRDREPPQIHIGAAKADGKGQGARGMGQGTMEIPNFQCPIPNAQFPMPNSPTENEWLFWVRDNGIGIKHEDLECIFEIFRRLHTRQEFPGTGIGLAICKKIIERHGGRIWAESEVGVGTTFYFTLPFNSDAR